MRTDKGGQVADLWGYGEDVLTLRALNEDVGEILKQLGDNSAEKDVVTIYRPSFGRRASYDAAKPRAEFGEFDAIIGTPSAIYLVETKWSQSTEVRSGVVVLRDEQLRRHQVMHWYLAAFADRGAVPSSERPEDDPPFEGVKCPPGNSVVARNLQWICERLQPGREKKVENVLLWIGTDGNVNVPSCSGFRVVELRHEAEDGSNFIHVKHDTK